jgi:hypothetical protein
MQGLTVDGDEVVFGGRRARLSAILERAGDTCADPTVRGEFERAQGHAPGSKPGEWVRSHDLTRATRLPAEVWAYLLGEDEALAAELAELTDDAAVAKRAGPAILAAVTRLAHPLTHSEAVAWCGPVAELARAECARRVGARPKRGASEQERDRHARRLALLAQPTTAEAATVPGAPAMVKRGKEVVSEFAGVGDGVRLRGGLCGPRGAVVRPVGQSVLAWAAMVWQQHLASLAETEVARPAAKTATEAERVVPMIVLLDGAPVATSLQGDGAWATNAAARAERGELAPLADDEVSAFETRAFEACRLGGEVRYLEEIADDDSVRDVDAEMMAGMRALAKALVKAAPNDPRLLDVRREVKDREKTLRRLASELDRRSMWGAALAWTARRIAEAEGDRLESALVDAWMASPPLACARLLAPGAVAPADLWLAHVARAAICNELDALDERLTRPALKAKAVTLRNRLLPKRQGLVHAACAAVANARDEQAGVTVTPCKTATLKDVAEVVRAAQTSLGCGECAVAVGDDEGWRAVRGTLPVLLAAGLCDVELRSGVPCGSWSPDVDLRTDALVPEATAWAVQRWLAAGCEGDPPRVDDAVRAVREALAEVDAKRSKRGRR